MFCDVETARLIGVFIPAAEEFAEYGVVSVERRVEH